MYDPELTLAVALQAYAGLREGEVVNLTYGRINLGYGGFGSIGDITLDITEPVPFAHENRTTSLGEIKINREQKVYTDFVDKILNLYQAHTGRHQAKKYTTEETDPVFRNKWGCPRLCQKPLPGALPVSPQPPKGGGFSTGK